MPWQLWATCSSVWPSLWEKKFPFYSIRISMLQLLCTAFLPRPVHFGALRSLSPIHPLTVALFSWRWVNPVLSSFPSKSWTFNHLVGFPLDLFQYDNVFLVWERSQLHKILQMGSNKCWTHGNVHLPGATGNCLASLLEGFNSFNTYISSFSLVLFSIQFLLFMWEFHHRCKALHLPL